jgi:hypothetical protein
MKKQLMTTTALVAAGVMAVAAVSTASAAKLKLGGYTEQWLGWGGKGTATTVDSQVDVQQDSEINFDYKQKLSNGMTVGGRFEMEADVSSSGTYDEVSMYVKGGFGKIIIGANDVAAAYTGGAKVVGPVGLAKSDAGKWVGFTSFFNNHDVDLGAGDYQNITYQSPKVNGVQVIASYTPDGSSSNASRNAGGKSNWQSVGVNYSGKASGGKFKIAAGYTEMETAAEVVQDGWNASASVSMGKMSFSAGYSRENEANTSEFLSVGAIYKLNKKDSVSFGYSDGETDVAASTANTSGSVMTVGFARNLGGGVTLAASGFKVETDHVSATNVSEIGIVGGLKVKF